MTKNEAMDLAKVHAVAYVDGVTDDQLRQGVEASEDTRALIQNVANNAAINTGLFRNLDSVNAVAYVEQFRNTAA